MQEGNEKQVDITDEALAKVRALIGTEIGNRPQPYLTEATRDSIRHWAEAMGDRNRLWSDEAYAKSTSWGALMGPPTILAAFDKLSSGYRGGLPGVHSFFGGIDWRWNRPVFRNDEIRVRIIFNDLIEKESKFSRRMFQQISTVLFVDQNDEVICEGESWGMRIERGRSKEKGKYKHLTLKTYTTEDIAEVTRAYDAESIRGATPRYWEDVNVGDELTPINKGPYSATNAVAYEMARGGLYIKSHGFWYDYLKRHPALGVPNELGVPEPPERVHWDSAYARKVGVPAAYDYGPERIAWLGNLLTNWIGDDGFVTRLMVRVSRFNLEGDLTRCYGRVTGKEQVNGRYVVHCDIWCMDQRGERNATGVATLALPSKNGWLPAHAYGGRRPVG